MNTDRFEARGIFWLHGTVLSYEIITVPRCAVVKLADRRRVDTVTTGMNFSLPCAVHFPSLTDVSSRHTPGRSGERTFRVSDKSGEYFFFILSGVRLSTLGTAANIGLLYQIQMIDDGDCGAIGGMKFGRGNSSTRRKPASVSLVHHKPHMSWTRLEPEPPRWKTGDYRLSYGTALVNTLLVCRCKLCTCWWDKVSLLYPT
jgi:hypothetical protein